MKQVQFSIVMLLGGVTLAALGCAALVNASPVVAALIVTATVLLWLGAIVGAVYSRSPKRPFFGGFAICAGLYLLLAGPLFEGLQPYLLTRVASDAVYGALVESQTPRPANITPTPATPVTYRAVAASPPPPAQPLPIAPAPTVTQYYVAQPYTVVAASSIDHSAFTSIGHSLWAILLGAIGGALAMWCSASAARGKESAVRSVAATPDP